MNQKNVSGIVINITSGTIIKTVLIFALAYLLFYLRDFVLVVLVSIVIASAVEPATKWFKRYKIPRVPAVLAVYFVVVVILAGLFSFFVPALLGEANSLLTTLPQHINSITAWGPFNTETQTTANSITGGFSLDDVIAEIRSAFSGLHGGFLSAMSAIFGGIFSLILIVMLSFYFAVKEDGVDEFLRIVTPLKHSEYVSGLWKRTQHKIGLWIQGQFLLSVIVAVLTYLGLTILGVPYALLLALLAGLLELIPLFGPIISAIPAVVLAFVNGISFADPGVTSAIIVALFFVLIQQFENHLIYPLVIRKVVGVHPILVIIALVVGWNIAGFLGLILAVPVVAGIMEFVCDVEKNPNTAVA